MWFIIEFIGLFFDFSTAWRAWICIVPSVGIAMALQSHWQDHQWVWLVSIPVAVTGSALGIRWHVASEKSGP